MRYLAFIALLLISCRKPLPTKSNVNYNRDFFHYKGFHMIDVQRFKEGSVNIYIKDGKQTVLFVSDSAKVIER